MKEFLFFIVWKLRPKIRNLSDDIIINKKTCFCFVSFSSTTRKKKETGSRWTKSSSEWTGNDSNSEKNEFYSFLLVTASTTTYVCACQQFLAFLKAKFIQFFFFHDFFQSFLKKPTQNLNICGSFPAKQIRRRRTTNEIFVFNNNNYN